MKIIASTLFSLLLVHAQAQALVGGPFQNGQGVSVLGSYSGFLLPKNQVVGDTSSGEFGQSLDVSYNTFGLFNVSVKTRDLAIGNAVIFQDGKTFVGGINGFADPDTSNFFGAIDGRIIESTSSFIGTVTQTNDVVFSDFVASGVISAEILSPRDLGSSTSSTRIQSARMSGEATVTVSDLDQTNNGFRIAPDGTRFFIIMPPVTVSYVVSGFKSSSDNITDLAEPTIGIGD